MQLSSTLLVARRCLSRCPTAVAVLAVAITCDHSVTVPFSPPAVTDVPVIANMVVGEAAKALGQDGHLRLDLPSPLSPLRTEVTELQARQLTQAFVTTHARGLRKMLESDHGGPINIEALHVCGPVWYANSAFEPLPAEVPSVYHRMYGPWWLVTLCGPSEQSQVSVAVSAYATELTIRDGQLVYPPIFGEEMHVMGIPRSLAAGLPPSPERAVQVAARVSGVRVSGVPELIAAPPGEFPQSARWRLRLEKDVSLAANDGGISLRNIDGVKEVFVSTTFFAAPDKPEIADDNQPATLNLTFRAEPTLGSTRAQVEARASRTATLYRRLNFPLRYLTVGTN